MKRFLLFILLSFCFCKTPKLILKQPDSSTVGAVAFGLVVYDSEEKNLLDESNRLKQVIISRTSFFEFDPSKNKLNYKNPLQIDFSTDGDTIQIEKEEFLEKTNFSFKVSPVSYFILTDIEDDKFRLLGNTSYGFTTVRFSANGKRNNQMNHDDILMNLDSSQDQLNLKILPNQINFKGIFIVDLKTIKEGKFFDSGEKRVGYLKNADGTLGKLLGKETLKKLYSSGIVSNSAAEKKFLEYFMIFNKQPYWSNLARARYKEVHNMNPDN